MPAEDVFDAFLLAALCDTTSAYTVSAFATEIGASLHELTGPVEEFVFNFPAPPPPPPLSTLSRQQAG